MLDRHWPIYDVDAASQNVQIIAWLTSSRRLLPYCRLSANHKQGPMGSLYDQLASAAGVSRPIAKARLIPLSMGATRYVYACTLEAEYELDRVEANRLAKAVDDAIATYWPELFEAQEFLRVLARSINLAAGFDQPLRDSKGNYPTVITRVEYRANH